MSEKISLLINGQRFQFWQNVEFNLSFDSIDKFGFTTPFDADNVKFRENFQPLTYSSVQIRLNDEPILNGIIAPKSCSIASKNLSLGGYSNPGVLNDLPIPIDKFPLEFKNQDLRQIAATAASYYDIPVKFSASPGASFSPLVSPAPGEKILAFLIKLAQKRSLLVSNTQAGELEFFIPGVSQTVTPLIQGEPPLADVSASFNEQQMFSSVTGLGAAEAGRDPESFTIKLLALFGINRPFIYTVSEAKGAELQAAVKFKAGRLFASAIPIKAEVSTWRGINNKIWTPGDFISLRAPNIYFYNETRLMIRNATFSQDAGTETASLDLVFPGVYSGELPQKMPWS